MHGNNQRLNSPHLLFLHRTRKTDMSTPITLTIVSFGGLSSAPSSTAAMLESLISGSFFKVDYVPGDGVTRYQSEIDNSPTVRAR